MLSAFSSKASSSDGMGLYKCIWYEHFACFVRHYECWKAYNGFRATYAPLQKTSISGKALCISAGQCKTTSNQIKSLLLSHHHSTSALVSEILMSVLQTVQKNNRQFTYGQTVQKTTTDNLHMDRQCKKATAIYIWTDSAKKNNSNLHMDRQCKKTTNNLHMDRQCKKAIAIYIWTVHIYRLYRRQCAKYTYIYSVHLVYYKNILNY